MNEKCIDCKAPATQLAPFPLCSKHWTDRYAKGPLRGEDGELLPYKKSLRDILKAGERWQLDRWQDFCDSKPPFGPDTTHRTTHVVDYTTTNT